MRAGWALTPRKFCERFSIVRCTNLYILLAKAEQNSNAISCRASEGTVWRRIKPHERSESTFKQADFPQATLQQAQKIASAIVDNFGGEHGSPPDIALALGISPTSSAWPPLAGASVAYGLTEGGVNANIIKLTNLGKKLVAPEEEGEDVAARREAILKPRILKEFFERYRRAKLPNDVIAVNVLKALGLTADRVQSALEIIKVNGRYAGIIRETPTGPFVNLDSPGVPAPAATPALPEQDSVAPESKTPEEEKLRPSALPASPAATSHFDTKLNRV